MIRLLVIFLCIPFILTGCASTETAIVTHEVQVPVFEKVQVSSSEVPSVDSIVRSLPVNQLNTKSSSKEVVVAYDKSIRILIDNLIKYRTVIDKTVEVIEITNTTETK